MHIARSKIVEDAVGPGVEHERKDFLSPSTGYSAAHPLLVAPVHPLDSFRDINDEGFYNRCAFASVLAQKWSRRGLGGYIRQASNPPKTQAYIKHEVAVRLPTLVTLSFRDSSFGRPLGHHLSLHPLAHRDSSPTLLFYPLRNTQQVIIPIPPHLAC
jgi:hypothetical protein